MFKEQVIELLKLTALGKEELERLVEVPSDPKLGDYAFPCFSLAKELRKSPAAIASGFAGSIKPAGAVARVEANGSYINFFLDKDLLSETVLKRIFELGSLYGAGQSRSEKIMVEYPAPNTNKPLHLGHARNMLLGSSLCNILGFAGFQALPVDLVNDRGVHICKSMLAYKKWGNNKEPDKKSDHFVGDFYVLYAKAVENDPELEKDIQKMLVKWENNDLETVKLWSKMRKWTLDGFKETYEKMGVHHKKTYYESEFYAEGKQIVLDGLKNGLFEKDEKGAVIVDLEKYGLGKKVLLREDGTTIYITQDLFLAKLKFMEFHMDRSVHVVGNEQIHHFRVLFKILELLKMPFAEKCYHLSYGLINLPEGRMKSREGTVVDCDDLIDEMRKVASVEISKRHMLSDSDLKKRANAIGLGALKFFILKYDPQKDFIYNPEESISFDGETGPYVQYAHARICSIFKAAGGWGYDEKMKLVFSHEKELSLIRLLSDYPDVVAESAEKYDPSTVARFALLLAQTFSNFYQECPVIKEEESVRDSRLALIFCVRVVLQSSLSLLGIDAPEEM
jgi:arginyl-tRNA synthetase